MLRMPLHMEIRKDTFDKISQQLTKDVDNFAVRFGVTICFSRRLDPNTIPAQQLVKYPGILQDAFVQQ
ncbi:uncharacterized protein LOC143198469 isoform X2 [Rhynchophorus ferrugineus]|uniref:uncharacterized protein LOC143198469 isoform X2 n=1 Tax=Rhynchophorus ferrugineus TaxID=354439 RepID=UPI003FCCB99A